MVQITDAGLEPTDLTGYVEDLEELLRSIFGQDLDLASETPQGQLAGVLGLYFTNLDELAVHGGNGLNLFKAVGLQLDDMGSLFSLLRIDGEQSTVTATLTGTAGTLVAAGARARTSEGATFASDQPATIGPGGTVDVLFRATQPGPVVAPAGSLTQIVDVISGWTGITNTAAAQLGRLRESDLEYQRRFRGEVAVNARDALEAIRARVLAQPGVTDCLVHDNDTSAQITRQGISIPAGNVLVIVEGGASADIADAIAKTKGAGTPTAGNQTEQYTQASGSEITIRFRRVTAIPVQVVVELTVQPGFPSTGLATMRKNLVQWFQGIWPVPGPGIFDQTGIGIGEEIDLSRLRTPLNAVPNHTLGTITVERVGGAALGTPELDERYTLEASAITLTIS